MPKWFFLEVKKQLVVKATQHWSACIKVLCDIADRRSIVSIEEVRDASELKCHPKAFFVPFHIHTTCVFINYVEAVVDVGGLWSIVGC